MEKGTKTISLPITLFKCSTCKSKPALNSKMFQCVNGHSICEQCYGRVSICPNCRVDLNLEQPIRNLLADEALEYAFYNCAFKSRGCAVVGVKREIGEHEGRCGFRNIRICELLGFEACEFDASNPVELALHLEKAHKVPYTPSEYISLRLTSNWSSRTILGNTLVPARYRLWPIDSRPFFLHLGRKESKSWRFVCLLISDDREEAESRRFESSVCVGKNIGERIWSPCLWYKKLLDGGKSVWEYGRVVEGDWDRIVVVRVRDLDLGN